MFKSNPSTFELLKIAYEIAASLSDAHNFDSKGRPTISHTDVKPDQWILGSDGHYRLSDFNRARFLGWDKELNTTCPFYVGKNGGIVSIVQENLLLIMLQINFLLTFLPDPATYRSGELLKSTTINKKLTKLTFGLLEMYFTIW